MKRMIQLSMTLAVLLFLPLAVSAQPKSFGLETAVEWGLPAISNAAGTAIRGGKPAVLDTPIGLSEFSLTNCKLSGVNINTGSYGITIPCIDIDAGGVGGMQCLLSAGTNHLSPHKIKILIEFCMAAHPHSFRYTKELKQALQPSITNIVTGKSFGFTKQSIKKKKLCDGSLWFTASYEFRLSGDNIDPSVLNIPFDPADFEINIVSVRCRAFAK